MDNGGSLGTILAFVKGLGMGFAVLRETNGACLGSIFTISGTWAKWGVDKRGQRGYIGA